MKTGRFEGEIALGATDVAQGRDERTQREPTTFDFDFGSAWLVAPADCAGTHEIGRTNGIPSLQFKHRLSMELGLWREQQPACCAWRFRTRASCMGNFTLSAKPSMSFA